jgi:hypothetical protein
MMNTRHSIPEGHIASHHIYSHEHHDKRPKLEPKEEEEMQAIDEASRKLFVGARMNRAITVGIFKHILHYFSSYTTSNVQANSDEPEYILLFIISLHPIHTPYTSHPTTTH